jgi:hypothetical protein
MTGPHMNSSADSRSRGLGLQTANQQLQQQQHHQQPTLHLSRNFGFPNGCHMYLDILLRFPDLPPPSFMSIVLVLAQHHKMIYIKPFTIIRFSYQLEIPLLAVCHFHTYSPAVDPWVGCIDLVTAFDKILYSSDVYFRHSTRSSRRIVSFSGAELRDIRLLTRCSSIRTLSCDLLYGLVCSPHSSGSLGMGHLLHRSREDLRGSTIITCHRAYHSSHAIIENCMVFQHFLSTLSTRLRFYSVLLNLILARNYRVAVHESWIASQNPTICKGALFGRSVDITIL